MKKASLSILTVAAVTLGLFSFTAVREGGIQGKVTPAEGAKDVIAVSGTDTLRADLNSGTFVFSKIKKGTYKVWVRANAPFKDAGLENVVVADSATTDVGEIKLTQ